MAVCAFVLFPLLALGQTTPPVPAPTVNTWSITANAVSLPGANKTTLPGTLAGMDLKVTPNFNMGTVTFLTSSAQTNVYMAGGSYTLAGLSKKLNNVSPTLAGYNFRFSVHGYAGESRVTQTNGALLVGAAGMFGGEVDYAPGGNTTVSLGVRVDDLIASQGLPKRNNLVVAFGPAIHF